MPDTLEQKKNLRDKIFGIMEKGVKAGIETLTPLQAEQKKRLAKRVIGLLKGWEEAGRGLKETAQKAIPEFMPKPKHRVTEEGKVILPREPSRAEVLVRAAPTVAARTAIEAVPTTPSEIGTIMALSGAGRALGATGKALAKTPMGRKAITKIPKGIRAIPGALKKPLFPKKEIPATIAHPILGPTGEIAKVAQIPKVDPSQIISPQMATQQLKNLTEKAVDVSTQKGATILKDQSQRVFKRIVNAYDAGIVIPKNLPEILKQNNMTGKQFADLFVDTVSTAGRTLGFLSKASKQLGKYLPADAKQILKRVEVKPVLWDRVKNAYVLMDNKRRGLLVTQWATAVRNAVSQGVRYNLQLVDDIVKGSMKVALKGEKPTTAYRDSLEDVFSLFRRMSPNARGRLETILNNNVLQKTRLLSNIMGDITLDNKVINLINTPNILQEHFFRKIAVDAKLHTLLAKQGLTTKTASPKALSEALPQAVDHALKMTFAAQPEKGFTRAVINMYREVPMLTMIQPFPRFWANSVKFLMDYNPLGYARLFNPKFIQQLASKNADEAFTALSQTFTGTLMWTGAFALRNSKYAGEKWYEIKVLKDGKDTGKRVDTRAMAPWSTLLFLNEAMKAAAGEETTLTKNDYLQGAVSINRIAGTGLAFVDWIRSDNTYKTVQNIKDVMGQYVGGFTVPFRTVKDLLGSKDIEERLARTTRLHPLTGPAMANIPFVSRKLPPAYSILRKKPLERETPGLRQATGVTIKTKTPLEIEMHKLGISFKGLIPRTGDRELDYEAGKLMGVGIEKMGNQLVTSPNWEKLDKVDKTVMLRKMIGKQRGLAIKMAKAFKPKRAILHKIKTYPVNKQKRIVEVFLKQGRYTREEMLKAGINLKKLGIKKD